jgi:hypothetical protein
MTRAALIALALLLGVNLCASVASVPGLAHAPQPLIASPREANVPQVRMPISLRPTGGGGGGATFTQSDLTWLGDFLVPNTGTAPNIGTDTQPVAFRKVSGVVHVMLIQAYEHGNFGPTDPGAGAVYEYADPGSGYNKSWPSAPHGTFIKNWGLDGSGNTYDMWHGQLGTTTCLTTTEWSNPGGFLPPCTLGRTDIQIGDAGGGSDYIVPGAFFRDDGSGHCCMIATQGQAYGNYSHDVNLVMADLVGTANTTAIHIRTCAGTDGTGGTGGQNCGGKRGLDLWDQPDGSMGIGGANAAWQQNSFNKGPSFFWGQTWPTMSYVTGYGSTRGGDPAFRTTDLVSPTQALALYNLDGNLTDAGAIISGPNITFRRTTDATQGNYLYEDVGGTDAPDPDLYGGVGGWSSLDKDNGTAWVNTSPKSAVIVAMTLSVGHTWYKTNAGFTYQEKGTGPTLIFQRNALESCAQTNTGNIDSEIAFCVKPAFYTNVVANAVGVKFLNPGTSSAGFSVTTSGNIITVHLATNGSSVVTTTANDVVTGISGNSTANSLVSMTVPGTGLATVDTITDAKVPGTGDEGAIIASGVMTPCHGPQFCTLHNVDSGVTNTGPVTNHREPALAMYSTADVLAAPTSGNPEYSLDPDNLIYLHNIDATMAFAPENSATFPDYISGVYFDSATNKLYVVAPFVDDQTWGVFIRSPIIHVFLVATSMPVPVPSEMIGSMGLIYLLSLAGWGRLTRKVS